MSTYHVVISHASGGGRFTGELAPEAWGARDAQEFAQDLARCLKPGHVVEAWNGSADGAADGEAWS